MPITARQELDELHAQLKQNLASPRADTAAFLQEALKRLRWVPFSVEPRMRIDCLLAIAQQFYHHGQQAFSAVEPAAVAVMVARDVKDPLLLRKALTFQGVILSSTSNPGDALRSLSEALDLAEQHDDVVAAVWSNIGMALYEAALYVDSKASFARAADLALGNVALRAVRIAGLTNCALCCIHLHEYEEGIDRIRGAISLSGVPASATEMLNRTLAESNFTRLLLATGQVREAAERAHLAKEFAVQAKSVRAEIAAACAEGLVEVYSGNPDVGLSRGMSALEKARLIKPSLRETLLALVQATERAGRHDRALSLHRELTLHIRKAQQDNIVRHQELHLKRIEIHEAGQYPEHLLDEKERELRSKLAEQTVGTRQGDLLEQMAFTAEMRDDSSGEHCYRVAKLAALLGQELGEDEDFVYTLELAARLHDIGKIGVPETILQKTSPLTDGERQILQTHTTTGADLLSKSKVSYAALAEEIARHHHERWDGNGFPDGISGTAIPLAARLVAVADTYDTLTHGKSYRRSMSSEEALLELERNRNQQLEPALVDLFVPLVRKLRTQHRDLDAFLGAAARASSLNQARQRVAASLARPLDGSAGTGGRRGNPQAPFGKQG